jgi:hypothetical protein
MGGRAKAAREGLAISFRLRCPSTRASILRQNVNLAKLLLNPLDALGAERVRTTVLPARYGPPAVFSRYDRNGNGRCAVATRPQLFRKNSNQISARNLGFSHAPPPPVFQGSISKANSGWLDTLASPTCQLSKRNHSGCATPICVFGAPAQR